MTSPASSLTIAVIPAYNEATRLFSVIGRAKAFVQTVLVIDDGSEDDTAAVAHEAGCQVLRNETREGVFGATRRGLTWASHFSPCAVATLDADGQHDPGWISCGLDLLNQGCDVVLANRFANLSEIPQTKILSNNVAWDQIRRIIGRAPACRDVSCGFRIYGPKALDLALSAEMKGADGYSFVQASYAALNRSSLKLGVLDVPWIPSSGTEGTLRRELLDFLTWLNEASDGGTDFDNMIATVRRGQNLRIEMQEWTTGAIKQVLGVLHGDSYLFTCETK